MKHLSVDFAFAGSLCFGVRKQSLRMRQAHLVWSTRALSEMARLGFDETVEDWERKSPRENG